MRIVEEEIQPKKLIERLETPVEHQIEEKQTKIADEEEVVANQPKRTRKRHQENHGCSNFFSCLFLMIFGVAGIIAVLVIFVASPIIKSVDKLPTDFPKQIALYQVESAKIKVQESVDKQQLVNLFKALPDWVIAPWLGYLTTDAKTQIIAGEQNPQATIKNVDLSQLAQAVAKTAGDKTVSLSWSNLGKTKEDVFEYYKSKLVSEGFVVKESISDYEIDLSFAGGGTSGAMSIVEDFSKSSSSVIEMIVNYKNQ